MRHWWRCSALAQDIKSLWFVALLAAIPFFLTLPYTLGKLIEELLR